MAGKNDTEELVEHTLAEVRNLLAKSQALGLPEVQAIAEQLRVEAMLARTTRHRRRIYSAIADFYEHVAEERRSETGDDPDRGFAGAVRAIIDNFDDDDEKPDRE